MNESFENKMAAGSERPLEPHEQRRITETTPAPLDIVEGRTTDGVEPWKAETPEEAENARAEKLQQGVRVFYKLQKGEFPSFRAEDMTSMTDAVSERLVALKLLTRNDLEFPGIQEEVRNATRKVAHEILDKEEQARRTGKVN
jgi:hypothetical protein